MRYVAGCMSGTSMDGIDAALLAINGHGLEMQCRLINCASSPFDERLAADLRQLAEQQPCSAAAISAINQRFSTALIAVLQECCAERKPDLISIHGQTIFHAPPQSWQLLQPSLINAALNCDVVSDLRAADLAAGGQGAPITPLADFIFFRKSGQRRSIINLGGFCNITTVPAAHDPDQVQGFDCCACNHMLDHIARSCFERAFDADGALALQGSADDDCTAAILGALQVQRSNGRSLGSGDELFSLIDDWAGRIDKHALAASACSALARCISEACGDSELLICAGGGILNHCLMQALQREHTCQLSDDFGVPAQYREAMAMAVLGALCQDKIPITLPQVTGASHKTVAGNWTLHPGS